MYYNVFLLGNQSCTDAIRMIDTIYYVYKKMVVSTTPSAMKKKRHRANDRVRITTPIFTHSQTLSFIYVYKYVYILSVLPTGRYYNDLRIITTSSTFTELLDLLARSIWISVNPRVLSWKRECLGHCMRKYYSQVGTASIDIFSRGLSSFTQDDIDRHFERFDVFIWQLKNIMYYIIYIQYFSIGKKKRKTNWTTKTKVLKKSCHSW